MYLCLSACARTEERDIEKVGSVIIHGISHCSMICAVLISRELAEEMEASKRADAAQEAREHASAAR
jgi:hypothetical protein